MASHRKLLILDQQVRYRVVHEQALPDLSDCVGISFDPRGQFLAITFSRCLQLYEHNAESSQERKETETWSLRATYHTESVVSMITCMTWTTVGVLAFASNAGDVSLALVDSEETVLKGFKVSQKPIKLIAVDQKMRYMAVAAGRNEIGIWEFSASESQWVPFIYLPLYQELQPDEEVVSAHWDNTVDHPVLIVSYKIGCIIAWDLDLERSEANPRSVVSTNSTIYAGYLSPDSSLFLLPNEDNGFDSFNMSTSEQGKSFKISELYDESHFQNGQNYLSDCAQFMFGGSWLVGSGVGQLILWHVPSRSVADSVPLGSSLSHHRVTHLSASGVRDEEELRDLRIAVYAIPQSQPGTPRLAILKGFGKDLSRNGRILLKPPVPICEPKYLQKWNVGALLVSVVAFLAFVLLDSD